MKPDYKNRVPESMLKGLIAGTVLTFILFLLFGAKNPVFEETL